MRFNRSDAITYVAQQVGYRSPRRYWARASFLFRKVPLDGHRVLDVGCGPGTFALWAAVHGAEYVLGIEPESSGSTVGTLQKFRSLISELGFENRVDAQDLLLQDVSAPEKPFDIVIMFNVINHLNEHAVQHLQEDPDAVESYLEILFHLRQLMSMDGVLIIADCARSNFWSALGLKSPIARTIEWHKHQNPSTWINVLLKAGFRLQDLRWSPLYPFGWLSANRFVQYFAASHFVLRLRAGATT